MIKRALSEPREFVITREHKRFAEFCDACRQFQYIGLCSGNAGVGKTWSARRYAQWDIVEPCLAMPIGTDTLVAGLGNCRALFYTPPVVNSPRLVRHEIDATGRLLNALIAEAIRPEPKAVDFQMAWQVEDRIELIIVDEADWLKMTALEQVRAIYDQRQVGVVLIGLPGIEKRLARYPQLYSRVGFVHHFKPLSQAETRIVLNHRCCQAMVGLAQAEQFDEEAIVAIIRVTGGNFRLLERLLSQIARILVINTLTLVTKDVVETARESLVIGAT